jgi:quinol monooxygenase YgiN
MREGDEMVNLALFVRMEAKAGREEDVAAFLKEALPLVQGEPATTAWLALRLSHSTFAICDAFPNQAGREAHLAGKVAEALRAKAPDLFVDPPVIEKAQVLASKLPGNANAAAPPVRGEQIPMQVGSELRIRNNGELILGNPELELGLYRGAADAMLSYRFDAKLREHVIRLLEPVAEHEALRAR